nr:hypothetical protein Q903MT_gene700 [Picea sitchensis]
MDSLRLLPFLHVGRPSIVRIGPHRLKIRPEAHEPAQEHWKKIQSLKPWSPSQEHFSLWLGLPLALEQGKTFSPGAFLY